MTSSTASVRSYRWAGLACAAAGFVLFHFHGNANRGYIQSDSLFYWWGFQWANPRSETQHGWMILGISAWLGWRNWRRLASVPAGPFPDPASRLPAAIAALLGGLALHAIGFAAQQTRVSIIALLVFTWGVLRLAGGRRWGQAALFPLGFMVFAIPISALDEIGLPLRLWVTDAGERIAHLAGIDVVRSGTQLLAADGRYNYDVAAPCSGVRSLMALAALSVLIGYLNFRSAWRRGLVLALTLPLVYLGNVVRIVAIIFAADAGGAAWGDRAHQIMGYGVFVIVLGGVLAAVGIIRSRLPEAVKPAPSPHPDALRAGSPDSGHRLPVSGFRIPVAVAGAVVLLAAVEMTFLRRLAEMPPRGRAGVQLAADGVNPVELPAFIGTDWIGRRAEVTAFERDILPADTGFSRRNYAYIPDRSKDVFFSIVLSGRDRTSIHRPELCLVGQGWTIQGASRHIFRRPGEAGGGFESTVLRVQRELPSPNGKIVVPQLVVYWFAGGEETVPSHWKRLLLDAWNRVVHGRADRWAYVLMQTDARDGEGAALVRMQAVLDGVMPVIHIARGQEETGGG